MKKRLLLSAVLCVLYTHVLLAQISNTETNIMLSSSDFAPSQVCPWNNPPSSSGGYVYEMYVTFKDGDDNGNVKRLPGSGYYSCTVTNNPNAYGSNISIDVPSATFPTTNNTSLGWDLSISEGLVFLRNTTTGLTYTQGWDGTQYICPALPIYISSFTVNSNYQSTNYLKFDWTAADESDYLSHYTLQKSSNNFFWTNEVLEPAQTGLGNHNYTVYANKPGYPWMWYRLRWVNENGFARSSSPIQVFNSGTATNVVCNYTNIAGSASVCAPQTYVYKLHNAPASGAAYSWSASNGTVTSTEQNGLKANISFSTVGNATVYTNSANSSCNKSKAVTVGGSGNLLVTSSITSYNSSHTFYNASVFTLWPGTTASQYTWYSNGNYLGGGVTSWPIYTYAPQHCEYVEAKVNTGCGLVTGAINLCFLNLCEGCDPERSRDKFRVIPVPANDIITVSMVADRTREDNTAKTKSPILSSDIYTLQMYDMFGNLKLERRNVSLKTDQRLDASHLAVGNYILYIQNAETKISRQVRIQR